MAVAYNDLTKNFKIDTKNTSYVFCKTNLDFIEHLYYGKRVSDNDLRYVSNRQIYSFTANIEGQGREFAESTMLTEISSANSSDFRAGSVAVKNADGTVGNRFKYKSHSIYAGRKPLANALPFSRQGEGVETLELNLIDEEKGVGVNIFYVVFPCQDVIARHIEIENLSGGNISVLRAQSLNLDIPRSDFDYIETVGMYIYEFGAIQRTPLKKGYQGGSAIGTTTHHLNPLFMLAEHTATEDYGEVYGVNLLFSGGFDNRIEVDRLGSTRIISGLNADGFNYRLAPNEIFVSPESVMTYSDSGIGQVSRNFHDHARQNVINNKFAFSKRPIVINSWECVDMNVNEDIMLDLAKNAIEIGADTVVLDDGWFRSLTTEGLGDFEVDGQKFPNGLDKLAEDIRGMGLKFGIWFEPEGVAVDSKFLADNPSGVLKAREQSATCRDELVMDFTIEQNIADIRDKMFAVLDKVKADYLKWDFNRYIHEAGSENCPYGELNYRQTVGVYKLLSEITNRYPDMLIEGCAGGGGRFDLGMLFFTPQIWVSDNTDPFARAYIQYGATLGYPTSAISCHLTKGQCTSQRESSLEFRYLVASMGVFGYEYDLTKLSTKEKQKLKEFSDSYNQIYEFALSSDLYRLIDVNGDLHSAVIQVSKDKKNALFTFIQLNSKGFNENILIRLKGLAPEKTYIEKFSNACFSGQALMSVGIRLPNLFRIGSGGGYQMIFTEVE